jgi:hypothetical protein
MHVVTIIMITIVNNKGGDSHYSWGHVHATRRRRLERLIGCPRGLNWDSSWSRSRIFPRELFDWPTSAATIVFHTFLEGVIVVSESLWIWRICMRQKFTGTDSWIMIAKLNFINPYYYS